MREEFDTDQVKEKLIDNDLALIIRPTFEFNKWSGQVDLCAILMPTNEDINEEEHNIIKDSLYALVTCYHLLNTDKEFANRINEEMIKLTDSGGLDTFINAKVGDVTLSTWTKTEGDVH